MVLTVFLFHIFVFFFNLCTYGDMFVCALFFWGFCCLSVYFLTCSLLVRIDVMGWPHRLHRLTSAPPLNHIDHPKPFLSTCYCFTFSTIHHKTCVARPFRDFVIFIYMGSSIYINIHLQSCMFYKTQKTSSTGELSWS